eukprot:926842-Pyramimonas_sp.AAC.1
MESVPHQESMDALGSQGWVSCGRRLVVELLLSGPDSPPRPEDRADSVRGANSRSVSDASPVPSRRCPP